MSQTINATQPHLPVRLWYVCNPALTCYYQKGYADEQQAVSLAIMLLSIATHPAAPEKQALRLLEQPEIQRLTLEWEGREIFHVQQIAAEELPPNRWQFSI